MSSPQKDMAMVGQDEVAARALVVIPWQFANVPNQELELPRCCASTMSQQSWDKKKIHVAMKEGPSDTLWPTVQIRNRFLGSFIRAQ